MQAPQSATVESGVKPDTFGRPLKPRKGGVLSLLTKFMPTNYNMVRVQVLCFVTCKRVDVATRRCVDHSNEECCTQLVFRTMNKDLHQPNASDDIARRFRNSLMPLRSATPHTQCQH